MTTRVSVVVPVYNTGVHIEGLIDSLISQSLPQDEFEVIFVDDGSTDETPARLDRLAEERPNVTVLHEPNSGWPGRPRNVGTDAARGEYVFYVDHDDWLGPEALERMTAYGVQNRADIVIGRYAGHHRGVAKSIFHQNWPQATLGDTPLLDSLTPHKMFRKAFLTDHGLRFPEGRRRLEDHVFVAEAYFLAERISVLSDYHCYFHVRRDDSQNAGYQRIDPGGYYANVREVVQILLKYTEPGPLRDRLLRRTFRTELLGRLHSRSFLAQPADYAHDLFRESRRVAVDLMPLGVDASMPPTQRLRALLLRENRFDDLVSFVGHDLRVAASARLSSLRWNDDGLLVLDCEGWLVDESDGSPWRYDVDGGALLMTTPRRLVGRVPREIIDCTDLVDSATLTIVLRRRQDSEEWLVPTESTSEVRATGSGAHIWHRAQALIDPRTAGGGRPLTPGIWYVSVRISQTGWGGTARLGSQRSEEVEAAPRPAIFSGAVVAPFFSPPSGNLSLDVGKKVPWLSRHVSPAPGGVRLLRSHDGRGPEAATQLQVTLPVIFAAGEEPAVRARLIGSTEESEVPARGTRLPTGELGLHADLSELDPGPWRVQFELDTDYWRRPWSVAVGLSVSDDGDVGVIDGPAEVARPRPSRRPAPTPDPRPVAVETGPFGVAARARRSALTRARRLLRRPGGTTRN